MSNGNPFCQCWKRRLPDFFNCFVTEVAKARGVLGAACFLLYSLAHANGVSFVEAQDLTLSESKGCFRVDHLCPVDLHAPLLN